MGRVERRSVGDGVSQITHDVTATFERQNDPVLLGRRDSRKHKGLLDDVRQGGVGHSFKFGAENDASDIEANLRADVLSNQLVVAGQYFDLDTVAVQILEG